MAESQTTLYSIELRQPDDVAVVASYLCNFVYSNQNENKTGSHNLQALPDLYCAENPISHPLALQIFVATIFSLIIIMSLIGNGVVMWIIIGHKVMRKPFNIFLFNLALSDCLNSVFNAGTTWPYNLYYRWWFGSIFCSINIFVGVVPTCVSVFTMMFVSFDRYRAVVNPLKARPSSNRKTFMILVLIWTAAILVGVLPAYYSQMTKMYFFSNTTQELDYHWMCSIKDYEYRNEYEQIIMLVQYVIPLIVLVFTYGRVMWAFKKQSYELGEERSLKKQKKAVKLILTVVVSFMVCWLPYQLYHAVLEGLIQNFKLASTCYLVSYWVAMANSAFNPIIYCYVNKRFRIGFRYAFRWLPCIRFSKMAYEASELFPERKALIDRSQKCFHKQSGLLREYSPINGTMYTKRDHTASMKRKSRHPDEATVYIESNRKRNQPSSKQVRSVERINEDSEILRTNLHLVLSHSSSSNIINDNEPTTQNFLVLISH